MEARFNFPFPGNKEIFNLANILYLLPAMETETDLVFVNLRGRAK